MLDYCLNLIYWLSRPKQFVSRVRIGVFASVVLSTLPSPTIDLVMPLTVPVKVGLASGAFK